MRAELHGVCMQCVTKSAARHARCLEGDLGDEAAVVEGGHVRHAAHERRAHRLAAVSPLHRDGELVVRRDR
eukprot:6198413-Pleurochrysis_carterae.AAC.1